MPMLDAALAFAITMLAVASIVTAIVGKIGASSTYRQKTFRAQLEKFYESHVKPVVGEEVDRATDAADVEANAAIADLMKQMKLEGQHEVSTKELLVRLGKSEMGMKFMAEVGEERDRVVGELATGWEEVGTEFSKQFRERARLASFIIGIAVAGLLNIDSIYLVDTYLNDDEAVAQALGQQDAMIAQYSAFLNDPPPGAEAVADFSEDIDSIRADIAALKGAGLPMGWDQAPWDVCPNTEVSWRPHCSVTTRPWWFSWSLWIAGVLITGYLAGLGAPFWYDLVSGLNHMAQNKRGSQQRNSQEAGEAA